MSAEHIPIRTAQEYADNWGFEREAGDHVQIARMISKYSPGGAVLDLGCGPMLPAWGVFHPRIERLSGMDRNPDNIALIEAAAAKKIPASHTWEKAGQLARALNPGTLTLAALYPLLSDLRTGDVTALQADWVGRFDVVTQIGCFACLPTDEEINQAIAHVARYLRKGGVFISVMWLAQPDYVEDPVWGGNERTKNKRSISVAFFKDCAAACGLKAIFESTLPSDETEHYRAFSQLVFQSQ